MKRHIRDDKCNFIERASGRDLSIILRYQEWDTKVFDRSVEIHKASAHNNLCIKRERERDKTNDLFFLLVEGLESLRVINI